MNFHALLRWKDSSWLGGTVSIVPPIDPGTKHFNDSELALLQQQRKAGNEVARAEMQRRGIKVHPRMAARKARAV